MPDVSEGDVSKKLLQAAVTKQVSEKLGVLTRDIGDVAKGSLDEAETVAARIMLLEMVRVGFEEFYEKMKRRIEEGEKKKIGFAPDREEK